MPAVYSVASVLMQAVVCDVPHSHGSTYKEPEAGVRELPGCPEEPAGGRAPGEVWEWHPEDCVRFGLTRAQRTNPNLQPRED